MPRASFNTGSELTNVHTPFENATNTNLLTGTDEQEAIWNELINGQHNIIVNACAGSGKCLGKGTPVLLANGRVIPVEKVKAGDYLMGTNSEPRKVRKTSKGSGFLY